MSKLLFDAIGKYIHPTRYRQIVETERLNQLTSEEQRILSEDQKHRSPVAKVHYQKRRVCSIVSNVFYCTVKKKKEISTTTTTTKFKSGDRAKLL